MMPPPRIVPNHPHRGLKPLTILSASESEIPDWHAMIIRLTESIAAHVDSAAFRARMVDTRTEADARLEEIRVWMASTELFSNHELFRFEDTITLFDCSNLDYLGLGAIIGVALAETWPSGPAGFNDWIGNAIAYSGIADATGPEATS